MLLPGQSLQFSVLKASQKKNLGCKLVNVSPWLLAQLSLQRLHQQNNSPSPLPHAMKFLLSVSCASSPRLSVHGRAKQLL